MLKEIENRRSIRKYLEKDVPDELLKDIIEAARLAPSGHNVQPWKFIILRGERKAETITAFEKGLEREKGNDKFLEGCTKEFPFATHTLRLMKAAPVIIAVLCTRGKNLGETMSVDQHMTQLIDMMSVGAAIENLLLEANSIGLGTLWIGAHFYAYPELKEVLKTENLIAGFINVGWPDENPKPRPRKPFDEICG
ncbi:nitroreductase family protein [Treponema sp.]|uniref:nitroreductase family protein n=1 Tax=Treponema sp. TaxID=166 RepID=UPI0038904492